MSGPFSPRFNRRAFLAGSAALGFAAGLSTRPLIDDFAKKEIEARNFARADWNALANNLVGPFLRPDDSPFRKFASIYNLAYREQSYRAQAIALCANTADVATAVKWARDNEIPLVARGGGHSYAGYSTTTGLIIDVSTMRSYYWSKPDELTFGAGARNRDLYNILQPANRTVTHGRCPTVGAAGFLLGGGIGFNMRLHGIASDALTATEIVTADGAVRQLPEKTDSELFWACRGGGGGNFGINTSFTLKTFPTRKITFFKAQWSGARADMAKVAFPLMRSLTGAPREVGSRFALTAPKRLGQDKHFGVNIVGQYQSDDDMSKAVEDLLTPALRAVKSCERAGDKWPDKPGPCVYQILFSDYWKAQTTYLIDDDKPFAFHEHSTYLTEPLDAETFDRASRIMEGWRGSDDHGGPTFNADFRFFQTGGAIGDTKAADTAFVHRDDIWLADIGLPWSPRDEKSLVDENIKWQNGFYDEVLKLKACNRRAYQNFIDPMLKDFAPAYYGDNLSRLMKIKKDFDPNNLFKFEQSIPRA